MLSDVDVLDLGSDLRLRYRYFMRESLQHPAKLHLGLLAWLIERYTRPGETIADPMGGIGSTAYAALLQRNVILREIEPKWLNLACKNAACITRAAGLFAGTINLGQADAREPWGYMADHILFSPPYGCDAQHKAGTRTRNLADRLSKFDSRQVRYSQRWSSLAKRATTQQGAAALFNFAYGDHVAQLGHLRGERYWQAMEQVYTQARSALHPGGLLILIIKDHIRDGMRVQTAEQTVMLCERLGFTLAARHARRVCPLSLWQRRRKERGEPVVEEEDVLVFRGEA
jgi:hypothetical protein